MVEGEVSHDNIIQRLSAQDYTFKGLWQQVESMVRKIESDEGVLYF